MAKKKRDYGPHYIPELDPASGKAAPNWHNRIFLAALALQFLSAIGGAAALFLGAPALLAAFGAVFIAAGLVVGIYLIGLVGF